MCNAQFRGFLQDHIHAIAFRHTLPKVDGQWRLGIQRELRVNLYNHLAPFGNYDSRSVFTAIAIKNNYRVAGF